MKTFGTEIDMPRAEHLFLVWLYTEMTSHSSKLKAFNEAGYNAIMSKLARHKTNGKFAESCYYLDSKCKLRLGAFIALLLPLLSETARMDLKWKRYHDHEVQRFR